MKFLIVVGCFLAVARANPGVVSAPLAYSAVAPSGFSYGYSSHVAAPVAYAAPAIAPVAYSAAIAPIAYSAAVAPVAHSAVVAPVAHSAVVAVEKTQYHAQDEIGQAAYGHTEAFQAHNAVQDAAGNKIGAYSYVAPNGQVFATNYVADALGYRVASNALPVDNLDVVAARAAHLQEVEVVKHRSH